MADEARCSAVISRQDGVPGKQCRLVSTCVAEWWQDMGAVWPRAANGALLPPAQAKLAELRELINHTQLKEQASDRPPGPSEIAIARAYVNAISGGAAR
jgi:hypothetical protein